MQMPLGAPPAATAQPARAPSAGGGFAKIKDSLRDIVVIVAGVLVALYVVVYAIASIKDSVASGRNAPKPGAISFSAYSDVEAAHITFTNNTGAALYECAKGTVTNTRTKQAVSSTTVCSGDLAPHASLTLEAPYPRYALQSVCGGAPDSNGTRYVDWKRCTFDVSTVDAAPLGPAPATSGSAATAVGLPPAYSLDAGVPAPTPRQPLRSANKADITAQAAGRVAADDPLKITKVEVNDGYNGKSVHVVMTSTAAAPPDKPTADDKTAADNKTITIVKGFVYGFDGFDEATAMGGSDFVMPIYADDVHVAPGGTDDKSWRIGYGSIATGAVVEITKVKYKDGTIWERPEQ
jgi:hypothetical protein